MKASQNSVHDLNASSGRRATQACAELVGAKEKIKFFRAYSSDWDILDTRVEY